MTTPPPDPDDVVQMNVRVPRWLRDQADARRAVLGMSRDRWVRNALVFAIKQKETAKPFRNTQGRTAPPPRNRD